MLPAGSSAAARRMTGSEWGIYPSGVNFLGYYVGGNWR